MEMASFDMSFGPSYEEPRKRQCRRLEQCNEHNDSIMSNGSGCDDQIVSQAAPSSTSFSEKLGSEVVSIYAGQEKKLYTVHKKLLSDTTEVFNAMFNGSFKEASDNTAHFPEDDVDAWELLVQWLYQGSLQPVDENGTEGREALGKRIKLYCLAETYGIVKLMDSTIDTIAQAYKVRTRTPDINTIRYVYQHTQERSPLRSLMSVWFYHLLVTRGGDDRPTRYQTELMSSLATDNPDLVQDLFELMRGQLAEVPKDVMDPNTVHPCEYHQHTLKDDPVCSSARPMTVGAAKLLRLMINTFPNSKKRWTVDSLARRLKLDLQATVYLVDELTKLDKIAWGANESGAYLECK